MKHTPGPWEVIGALSVQSKAGFQIARTTLAYQEHEETAEANTLLIAAAPDLLEACEGMNKRIVMALNAARRTCNPQIVNFMREWFGDTAWMDRAIDKARREGRERE